MEPKKSSHENMETNNNDGNYDILEDSSADEDLLKIDIGDMDFSDNENLEDSIENLPKLSPKKPEISQPEAEMVPKNGSTITKKIPETEAVQINKSTPKIKPPEVSHQETEIVRKNKSTPKIKPPLDQIKANQNADENIHENESDKAGEHFYCDTQERNNTPKKIKRIEQQGIASLLLSLVFIMYFWAMTKFLKFLKQRQVCCF